MAKFKLKIYTDHNPNDPAILVAFQQGASSPGAKGLLHQVILNDYPSTLDALSDDEIRDVFRYAFKANHIAFLRKAYPKQIQHPIRVSVLRYSSHN